MKLLNPIFYIFQFLIQLIFDLLVFFLLFTLIGAFMARNTKEVINDAGIPIIIHGDGFHTELYLPVKDSMGIINWMEWFDDSSIRSKHSTLTLINFAWAEYDWTLAGVDKKPKGLQTTLEIFLSPWNKSVMHVQWMNDVWPLKHPETVKRYLTEQQYRKLITYIQKGFELKDGKPFIRSYKGYYGWDYMYYSNRNYNSFNTCNQWTSDALNDCGIRNAIFSPFGWGLFYQLKKQPSN
jgi:uncharacterized protein (TIGR02117 family)